MDKRPNIIFYFSDQQRWDTLGCCHSLDHNIGRLVDTLKEKGIYDNTIIIYTSDHGSHFKTRNSEYKRSCHDGCIHIPLIIHGPGFEKGRVVEELVSLIDLPPTLLDCAGIAIPESYHGKSIRKLAQGDAKNWQEEVFLQISESHIGRAIRTQRYKYAVKAQGDSWKESGASTYHEAYFYDLQKDPHELCNLVSDTAYKEIRKELAARLVERMKQAGEEVPVILPAESV